MERGKAMARYVRLDDRAVLSVSGGDASGFLQGLVTNDIGKLDGGPAIHAALLTPQGKYLFDFLIFRRDAMFCLDCEADARPALAKRLAMYKLRADVAIDAALPDPVHALFGDGAEAAARRIEGAEIFADPRFPALGARVVGEGGEAALRRAGIEEAARADYDALRIANGIPDGRRDLVPEKSLLLEYGFDELNGVDFEKGCYVGQEVTARMKHRKLVRKRLVPVRIEGAAPDPGTPVYRDSIAVGEIRSSAGALGLALLRIDAIESEDALHAATATIRPQKPDWAKF